MSTLSDEERRRYEELKKVYGLAALAAARKEEDDIAEAKLSPDEAQNVRLRLEYQKRGMVADTNLPVGASLADQNAALSRNLALRGTREPTGSVLELPHQVTEYIAGLGVSAVDPSTKERARELRAEGVPSDLASTQAYRETDLPSFRRVPITPGAITEAFLPDAAKEQVPLLGLVGQAAEALNKLPGVKRVDIGIKGAVEATVDPINIALGAAPAIKGLKALGTKAARSAARRIPGEAGALSAQVPPRLPVELEINFPPGQPLEAALAASPDQEIAQIVGNSGIKRVVVDPPYSFSLSQEAGIAADGTVRLNPNMRSVNGLLHEAGHAIWEQASLAERGQLESMVRASGRLLQEEAPGYWRQFQEGQVEEAVAELFALLKNPRLPSGVKERLLSLQPSGRTMEEAFGGIAARSRPGVKPYVKSWDAIVEDDGGLLRQGFEWERAIEQYGDRTVVLKDVNGGRHVVPASMASRLLNDPLVDGHIREIFLPAVDSPVGTIVISDYTLGFLPQLAKGLARVEPSLAEHSSTIAKQVKAGIVRPELPPPLKPPVGAVSDGGQGIPPTGAIVDMPTGERLMADLHPASEVAEIAFQPDIFRKIAQLPVIRIITGMINPATIADKPGAQAVIIRSMLRHEGNQKAVGAFQFLERLGKTDKIFGPIDERGLLTLGPLKGKALNDVRTYPDRYSLTPEQRAWIDTADTLEKAKLDLLKRNGIEINELTFEEGGQFAGRRVWGKMTPEGELLEIGYIGAGPGRMGAKLGQELPRTFKTADEAAQAGFRYLPEDETLYLNMLGAYNRIADKQMMEWFLLKVPWRTTAAPEELVLAAEAAGVKFRRAQLLKAGLNRAVRGERLPESTIKSIGMAYPEEADALRAVIPQLQRGEETAAAVQRLSGKADELMRESQLARAKAISARSQASERAQRRLPGEAAIEAPAFGGKFLTGDEAQETARIINRSLSPEFNTALAATNKVNAVLRFFQLAGDASPMTIQLIFLMGMNPRIYLAAGRGFIRSLFDTTFHARYLAANNSVIQGSRNLIVSTSGAVEMTEAVARGGLLRKGPFRIAGKLLEPAARGYETALDVAGIELRKSLDYLATTPKRAAMVDDFVNEFRGMASSRRIGVSPIWRQVETASILAPQYNRAIAALLSDVFRGNLRGELARRSLAQGIAAISAMAVAISYARGESPDEILEHLNPNSPKFMTWEVAGQNIGPGSKVRSVMKLWSQSASSPEKLLEGLRKNPGLRFIRGNLAPILSDGLDILTGRNYIGDPTRDGMLSFAKEILAPALMPIWIQGVALEGGDVRGRIARGAAELIGFRAYPISVFQHLDQEANRIFGQEYQELEPYQRDLIRETEQVEKAEKRRPLTGDLVEYFKKLDAIEEERLKRLAELPSLYRRGDTSGLVNAYRRIEDEMRGRRIQESIDRDFDDVEVDDPDPGKRALAQYYATFDDPSVKTEAGNFVPNMLERLFNALRSRWTEEQRQYVLRNTNRRMVPVELLRRLPYSVVGDIRQSVLAREHHLKGLGLGRMGATP